MIGSTSVHLISSTCASLGSLLACLKKFCAPFIESWKSFLSFFVVRNAHYAHLALDPVRVVPEQTATLIVGAMETVLKLVAG
jgi:hypothetical protein